MMKMKKNIILIWILIAVIFSAANTHPSWARSPFKFPKLIDFNILKKSEVVGTCRFFCTEKTGRRGYNRELASLRLTNFNGLGFSKKHTLYARVYRENLSLFMESVTKSKKLISQVRIQEGTHSNGKKGLIYIYRQKKIKADILKEIDNKYRVINFLSTFLAASEKVAVGKHKTTEIFHFNLNKVVKIVHMVYKGQGTVPFQGKQIPVDVLLLTDPASNHKEILRLKIFKDNKNNCFPVSVFFKNDIELRARKVLRSQTPWGVQPLFVVNLTFMDAVTQSINDQTELAKLINGDVVEALNRELVTTWKGSGRRVMINEKDHQIPISDETVKKLVLITLNPDLSLDDKIRMITHDVMDPCDVDMIVTGQYVAKSAAEKVIIRPIVIFKPGKKIITEKWEFKTGEFVCLQTSGSSRKRVLCREVRDKIARIARVGGGAPQKLKPSLSLPPLFAAQLEFINPSMQTIGGHNEETQIILEAFANVVIKELKEIEKSRNKNLIINQTGHQIPNTLQNINNIIKTTFDWLLSKEDKKKKIVDEMMTPHQVEGIVTGQYTFNDRNPVITIRPIVVFKSGKRLLTESLQFQRSELVCPGPGGQGCVLCTGAVKKITAKVKPLLKKLHE